MSEDTPIYETDESAATPAPDEVPIRDRRLVTQPYDLVVEALIAQIKNGTIFLRPLSERNDSARQPPAVMYGDNYFDLFPGEKKRVPVEFRTPEAPVGTFRGTLIIAGTNVPQIRVPISLAEGR